VCAQKQAAQFQGEHALVTITAPTDEEPPDHAMVVLLDDLPLFTQNWHYSELRYPDLKHQLKATFTLRAPAHKALQEKILLPFGQVKGLHSIDAPGFSAQVKQELQRRMATPAPTLRECCDAATQLLAQGDGALAAGNPTAALDTYARAFKAIHILIEGRTRRILVDTFFHSTIPDGPYAGQTGITVRVTLRLRLVARTMAAHLALGAWADAAFWGTRSIRSIQDAMGTDVEDLLSAFLGDADTGLIYVRTAVALWKMECSGTAWTNEGEGEGYTRLGSAELWASGVRYLRQVDKEPVRRELEGYGLGKEIFQLPASFPIPCRKRKEERVGTFNTRPHHYLATATPLPAAATPSTAPNTCLASRRRPRPFAFRHRPPTNSRQGAAPRHQSAQRVAGRAAGAGPTA